MLCSGVVCISLSLVSTFLLTTVLQKKDTVEPVSREDRLELQKDVEAAEILAAVAAVLYMSYLWRTLFKKAPAALPQPTVEVHKEEKRREESVTRHPSEHKETQYHPPEVVHYVTAETQTSDCLLPVGWTSSDTQFSDSSFSMAARLSDAQMVTSSSETFQQPIAEFYTDGTPRGYPQTHTAHALLEKATTLDTMVHEVLELQLCKASQTPEELQPITDVALPVESPQSENPDRVQLPPNIGDFDTPPNSASDVSSPETDMKLVVIRKPTGHTPRDERQSFTVSVASGQSPRRTATSPRSPQRGGSSLPTPRGRSCAGRRRLKCHVHCQGQGGARAADGVCAATVRVTALPSPDTNRSGGDARPATCVAGQFCRRTARNLHTPCPTYASLHQRTGPASSRAPPTYDCKPPFV